MPYISVMTYPGKPEERKEALRKSLRDIVSKTLQVPPESVTINVIEISREEWEDALEKQKEFTKSLL